MKLNIDIFIQEELRKLTNKNFPKKYISQYIIPIINNIVHSVIHFQYISLLFDVNSHC